MSQSDTDRTGTEETGRLRAVASSLLEKSDDPAIIKNAAELLKLASDIDNQRAQTRKLTVEEGQLGFDLQRRRRFEVRKDYITLLTPLASILLLALTLVFQTYQFTRSEKDKEIEAEDARWADDVKVLLSTEKISAASVLLKSFVNSARYGEQAYKTVVQILTKTDDLESFKHQFGSVFEPVDWPNLSQVVDLDRALWSELGHLQEKTYNPKTNQHENTQNLSQSELVRYKSLPDQLDFVTSKIASVLRSRRPPGITLDLHSIDLQNGHLRNADLSGANLDDASFSYMDVEGANFDGISKHQRVRFFSTAWWKASKVDPTLLGCLMKYYKFKPDWPYNTTENLSQVEYDDATKHLGASSGTSCDE